MVTTYSCASGQHGDCGGLAAEVVSRQQLLVSCCECLCHEALEQLGEQLDAAIERLLEQEGGQL